MSKVNPLLKTDSRFDEPQLAGGHGKHAAKQDNIQLLRRAVLASLLWEDNCYVDGEAASQNIAKLIPLCDPAQVAHLAIEARIVQKLRHTPLFIVAEMTRYPQHNLYVRKILPRIITRADMLTDFLAVYAKTKKSGKIKPICNSVKQGLADCFDNFKEYHFAKYDRNAGIKIRDVMFLVHPKAKDKERADLYEKIANRTLKTPDTWEVALSGGADPKKTWERLISTEKIGGLAMLRNIANMKKANVAKNYIEEGLQKLKGQMLLPFNFYQSAKMNPEFLRPIEDAMLSNYKLLPKLPGRTLFIVDISGSMEHKISAKSQLDRMEVACVMAMLAANQCEQFELVATAGSDRNPRGSESAHIWIQYPMKGFGIMQQIIDCQKKTGKWGIFTRQCLEWCKINLGSNFDRIIIFSDSQDQDRINKVPAPFGKNNYICDVSSENRGINYRGVWTAEISGWSEHFLTYIAALEGVENSFEEADE